MAEFKKTFETVPDAMRSVRYLRRRLNHMLNVVEEYPDDADPYVIPDEVLLDLLAEMEKCDVAIRADIEDNLFINGDDEENAEMLAYKNLPVEVSFEDNILHIQCPIMVKRDYKESYYLGNCVEVALKILEEKGGTDLYQKLKTPWFILIVRHFTHETHSSYYRDNDHLEEANIINKIARQFVTSDGKFCMGFTSIAALTKEKKSYTEIFAYDLRNYDRMTNYVKTLTMECNPCEIRNRMRENLRRERDKEKK